MKPPPPEGSNSKYQTTTDSKPLTGVEKLRRRLTLGQCERLAAGDRDSTTSKTGDQEVGVERARRRYTLGQRERSAAGVVNARTPKTGDQEAGVEKLHRSAASANYTKTTKIGDQEVGVEKLRRRLTLGQGQSKSSAVSNAAVSTATVNISAVSAAAVSAVAEKDEIDKIMRKLNCLTILESLPECGGDKRSIRTVTDSEKQAKPEFSEKDVVTEGDTRENLIKELELDGISAVCKKGLKPDAPNQDAYTIVYVKEKFKLLVVFDGHGLFGHDVTHYLGDALVKLFISHESLECEPQKALVDSFVTSQQLLLSLTHTNELDSSMSGTTCTIAYVATGSDSMLVAHVGDSRAVLCQIDSQKGITSAEDLTVDHKPELPVEKDRIEKAGGKVVFDGFFNHRVYSPSGHGGLNMSRALGDTISHEAGVTEVPECKIVPIDVHKVDLRSDAGNDVCVIIASDGVWEFVSSQEAAELVGSFGRTGVKAAAEALASRSYDLWMEDSEGEVSDDITCILFWV